MFCSWLSRLPGYKPWSNKPTDIGSLYELPLIHFHTGCSLPTRFSFNSELHKVCRSRDLEATKLKKGLPGYWRHLHICNVARLRLKKLNFSQFRSLILRRSANLMQFRNVRWRILKLKSCERVGRAALKLIASEVLQRWEVERKKELPA